MEFLLFFFFFCKKVAENFWPSITNNNYSFMLEDFQIQ